MPGAAVVQVCRGREWRGGERQVRLLVETLAWRSEFRQHVITGRDTALHRSLAGGGPEVHGVPWRLALDPRALIALISDLRRFHGMGGQQVLIHAHDSHALVLAAVAARVLQLPLIATRRSTSPPGRFWRLPDRVIAISNAVATALQAAGIREERICRIPSAVPVAQLAQLPPERHPGLVGEPPVVVAAGALTPEKGHRTLLDALPMLLQQVPEVTLALVGDGPEEAALERQAHALGIAHRVQFLGHQESALPFIRASQVLAQPSDREALGTAVLEAMALGIPVVAASSGGLVELLGNGAGLLVPAGDPGALAAALARALTDPLLRGAVVHEARARVAEYDAPGVADQVAQVYRSALQNC
ncbi:MAG TPA: glycosyltransferase [Gemmatimonadales bacterium]|nr:glycosyltransferase [Gemmatimonadales bacterium]